MKSFDAATLARMDAGEIDYIDGVTFFFPSAAVSFLIGVRGEITWTDSLIGTQTFYGAGSLLSAEVPMAALGSQAAPITLRLSETYMPEGSGTPVNIFDDGMRETIDEEVWQTVLCVLSSFWLDAGGTVIERETVDIREIDDMPTERDEAGNPVRVAVLERPEIRQRDIAGKLRTSEFQKLIDPADKSFEHVGKTARQKITFGKRKEKPIEGKKNGWLGWF